MSSISSTSYAENVKKKLWLSYKKQKIIPGKMPDKQIQLDFVEKYNWLLEKAKNNEIVIMFYDPVHQLHNSMPWNCRIEKGKEVYLNSNTWRSRLTAMWWINPLTCEFDWIIIEDSCNTESTKATFTEIRKAYKDIPITIILDNAKYNRAYEVQNHARSIWITLEFLPPYSPNLNLIERLRKFMKKVLVKNRYYKTLDEFRNIFNWFFENLGIYKKELLEIFNHRFHILNAA